MAVITLLTLTSCKNSTVKPYSETFFAMGTVCSITLYEKIDDFNSILRAKYLKTLNKVETCWIFAFKQGYKDKSVRQDIKMEHLIHFIVMVISGIIDRANLEKIALEKIKLTTEMLIEMCVELIQKYLTKN